MEIQRWYSITIIKLVKPLKKNFSPCHLAGQVSQEGETSALCYIRPHAISLPEKWTNNNNEVTCMHCLQIMKKPLLVERIRTKPGEWLVHIPITNPTRLTPSPTKNLRNPVIREKKPYKKNRKRRLLIQPIRIAGQVKTMAIGIYDKNGNAQKIMELIESGHGTREISRITGASRNTVIRYRKIFIDQIGLIPAPCPCGRPAAHPGWCWWRTEKYKKTRC